MDGYTFMIVSLYIDGGDPIMTWKGINAVEGWMDTVTTYLLETLPCITNILEAAKLSKE